MREGRALLGPGPAGPLCASAVHLYILYQLTRHGRPRKLHLLRRVKGHLDEAPREHRFVFEDDALLKNTWWYPIMLDGKPTDIIEWQAMGPGKALACGLPRHSPQVVKETEVLGAGGLIARAKALRSELEKDGRRV